MREYYICVYVDVKKVEWSEERTIDLLERQTDRGRQENTETARDKERERERQTDRQTDRRRQENTGTARDKERETDRQIERQTDTERDGQTDTVIFVFLLNSNIVILSLDLCCGF